MTQTEDYEYLLELENVVGVEWDDANEQVVVFVTEKISEDELPDDAIVGNILSTSEDSEVVEKGEFRAFETSQELTPQDGSRTDVHRPVVGGISEGRVVMEGGGTAGPFPGTITDASKDHWADEAENGMKVRVSNAHVLTLDPTDPDMSRDDRGVCQPASIDGGTRDDLVGKTIGGVPIQDGVTVDCAARTTSEKDAEGYFGLDDVGESVRRDYAEIVGETLTKTGRTSGVKSAEVQANSAIVQVRYGDGYVRLRDQIITGYMSEPGDSGSPVFDADGNLLGLLFGGSSKATILCKISNVESELGVTFDDSCDGDRDDGGSGNGNGNGETGPGDGSGDGSDDGSGNDSDGSGDDSNQPPRGPDEGMEWEVEIERIDDADSMGVKFPDGSKDTIRLLGIDSPETGGFNYPTEFETIPDKPAGWNWLGKWGKKADEWATGLLKKETVTVKVDPEADRRGGYNRLLVYLYLDSDDEVSYNRMALEEGYARLYDSDFSKRDTFAEIEREARQNNVGLWSFNEDDEGDTGEDGGNNDDGSEERPEPSLKDQMEETLVEEYTEDSVVRNHEFEESGYVADFLVFDDDLRIMHTWEVIQSPDELLLGIGRTLHHREEALDEYRQAGSAIPVLCLPDGELDASDRDVIESTGVVLQEVDTE